MSETGKQCTVCGANTPYTDWTKCERHNGVVSSCENRDGACDPGCKGWFIDGEQYGQIARCDECARFPHDAAALLHAVSCTDCLCSLRFEAAKASERANVTLIARGDMEPRPGDRCLFVAKHGVSPIILREVEMPSFEVNQKIRVQLPSFDRWARDVAELVNGREGVIEKFNPDYGFKEGPAYLVAFDPPIERPKQPHREISGFWFEPQELQKA